MMFDQGDRPTSVVVVDDNAAQRAGRVKWLDAVEGVQAVEMSFEEARDFGSGWKGVDIAVLDGHDSRSEEQRREEAAETGKGALPSNDRFVGASVAAEIRRHSNSNRTRIVIVSVFARNSEVLTRRMQQVGVDFVFESMEVASANDFQLAILQMDAPRLEPEAGWWRRDHLKVPDVVGAIAKIDASEEAGDALVGNQRIGGKKPSNHASRKLRAELGSFLQLKDSGNRTGGGPTSSRSPFKAKLSSYMRDALGLDLLIEGRGGGRTPGPAASEGKVGVESTTDQPAPDQD
jgi:hypothetical protein